MAPSPPFRVDHTAAFIAYCQSRPDLHQPSPSREPTPNELLLLQFSLSALISSLSVPRSSATLSPPRPTQRAGSSGRGRDDEMTRMIRDLDRRMDLYEDAEIRSVAVAHLPPHLRSLSAFTSSFLQSSASASPSDATDALALALCQWFKSSFMTWIDPIICSRCGSSTSATGGAEPTEVERRVGGAGRVEIWECKQPRCDRVERFPRYNDLRTLLETRKGRCGEFANLFTLFLRAVGLRARYIWNAEDHVWNEYYSPSLKRWIHLDPSEGIANTPLVYSTGWSKALSYVLAFSLSGAADVTPIYLPPPSLADTSFPNTTLALPRERMSEPGLRRALEAVTEGRRRGLSKEERRELEEEDEREQAWMRDEGGKRGEEERMRREKQGKMGGRVSGTKEWRTLRGECVGRDGLRQEAGAGGGAADRGSSMMEKTDPLFLLTPKTLSSLRFFGTASSLSSTSPISPPPPTFPSSIRLTPSEPSSTGAIYLPFPLPSSTSFVSELTFRIIGDGADGMAFCCLVFDKGKGRAGVKLGEGGGGMGFAARGGEKREGWVVEVDTYQTVDRTADPDTPHISLHSPPDPHHRHSVACTLSPTSLPPLTDGRPYALRIQFDAEEKNVQVWLSDRPATESPDEKAQDDIRDWVLLFGSGANLLLPLEPNSGEEDKDKEMWLGVSAACGGIAEIHDVLDWNVWEASSRPSPLNPSSSPSAAPPPPPPLPAGEARRELKFAKDMV